MLAPEEVVSFPGASLVLELKGIDDGAACAGVGSASERRGAAERRSVGARSPVALEPRRGTLQSQGARRDCDAQPGTSPWQVHQHDQRRPKLKRMRRAADVLDPQPGGQTFFSAEIRNGRARRSSPEGGLD